MLSKAPPLGYITDLYSENKNLRRNLRGLRLRYEKEKDEVQRRRHFTRIQEDRYEFLEYRLSITRDEFRGKEAAIRELALRLGELEWKNGGSRVWRNNPKVKDGIRKPTLKKIFDRPKSSIGHRFEGVGPSLETGVKRPAWMSEQSTSAKRFKQRCIFYNEDDLP